MGSKAAGKLTEEQVAELKKSFDLFDKDDNGFITYKEVGTVMRSLGQNHTESEMRDAIAELDAYGYGIVDFESFLNFMAPRMKDANTEDDLKDAFDLIDKDQDGCISAAELHDVMASLGEAVTEEEAKDMVKKADLDGDGMVNYEEFMKMASLGEAVTEEGAKDMVKKADLDGDGMVNYEEFMKMVRGE